ncbi:MAG: Uma2 family endonuclease [Solirubrobacteraceae bacterium]
MTAEHLLRYSHEPYRQELIGGRLYEMQPPGAEHGAVALRIGRLLGNHVEEHGLGMAFGAETGFQLARDPDTVRAPDAAFVTRARVEATGLPRGYWPGPPDLAVEVISPNDRRTEVRSKALYWLEAGTRVVVVLDPPQRTAAVYRAGDDVRVLGADERLDLGDVVAGFAVAVDAVFV